MTYRRLRSDTLVRTLEQRYGLDLNARGDMKLRNLLRTRGFHSWSELLTAYRGQATKHARRRRVFISFHAEDLPRVSGLRLMIRNPNVELSLYDQGLTSPVNSEKGAYIRTRIKPMIQRCEVLLCLVGNGTAWRDWVDWEIRTAWKLRRGICAIRLRGTRGRSPPALLAAGIQVAPWGVSEIVAAIEQAAARRS